MNFIICNNNFKKNRNHEFQNFKIWYFVFVFWSERRNVESCVYGKVPPGIESVCVNRPLKLKFTVLVKIQENPFSQNFKISCNNFESENKKCSFCLCYLKNRRRYINCEQRLCTPPSNDRDLELCRYLRVFHKCGNHWWFQKISFFLISERTGANWHDE